MYEPVRRNEVFVAMADPVLRETLALIGTLEGLRVTSFDDGTSLLTAARSRVPACIVLDLQVSGLPALEILDRLDARTYPAPIFIVSGRCTIPVAVRAIKSGAVDLIEKPFDPPQMIARLRDAVAARRKRADATSGILPPHYPGRELLTPRETTILARVVMGASNKEIARLLSISPRTVEIHRGRVMTKLAARNAADLARIVFSAPGQRRNDQPGRSHAMQDALPVVPLPAVPLPAVPAIKPARTAPAPDLRDRRRRACATA